MGGSYERTLRKSLDWHLVLMYLLLIIIGWVNSYLVHTKSGLFLGIGAVIMSYLGKQKTLNAGLVPSKINQAALIVGIIDIVIGGLRIIWFFLEFLFKIF